MPAAIKQWWKDLRLKLENWHYQYISKRAGGMRWYKAELIADHAEIFRLKQVIESREAHIESLKAMGTTHPFETSKKLLRIIEEILVEPVLKNEQVQMYELRCWRDDYVQFKINVLNHRPESEYNYFTGSSYPGTIKLTRIVK